MYARIFCRMFSDRNAINTSPSPTMSAAIGGGIARYAPHQSLRSWWGFQVLLPIQLRRDDIQAPQHRHHVADLMPNDQVREHREVDVRRRSGAGAIRHAGAVAYDIKA